MLYVTILIAHVQEGKQSEKIPKSDLSITFSVIISQMDIQAEFQENESKHVSCNYGPEFKIKLQMYCRHFPIVLANSTVLLQI